MKKKKDAKLGGVSEADVAETHEDVAAQDDAGREVESAAEDPEFSPLQDVALRDAVREVQRLGAPNGGCVTYDELNRMMPQEMVDAVLTERVLRELEMNGVRVVGEEEANKRAERETEKEITVWHCRNCAEHGCGCCGTGDIRFNVVGEGDWALKAERKGNEGRN